MRKFLISMCAFVVLSPMAANAGPILNSGLCADGENTCYTGIENLVVGGVAYDVNWYSTFRTVVDLLISDPGVALFEGNDALASEAGNAINDVFNADGRNLRTVDMAADTGGRSAVGLWVVSRIGNGTLDFYVPWSNRDRVNFITNRATDLAGPFAIFTRATAVPEPGTLALLGAGVIGMGFARRRKKA